jgi:hypothetical protein
VSGEITADGARIRLTGGSITLDLGVSAKILRFIDGDHASRRLRRCACTLMFGVSNRLSLNLQADSCYTWVMGRGL